METRRQGAIVILVAAGIGLLAGCNFPRPPSPQEVAQTAAAETVSAQLTEVSRATATLPPTNTPAPPLETATPPPPTAPPPTATTGCADNSQFVADVTVPDDTNYAAGAAFTKTWRLRNTGTCPWTTSFDVVFVDGNGMGGPASVPLAGQVPPGSTVDVSVNLTAPSTNGTHRGNWRMRNDKDILFGTLFYVRIVVGPTPTPTASVHKAGNVALDSSSTGDLDTGSVPGGGGADLWHHAVSASERYLAPQNGATIRKMSGAPDYAACAGASLSSGEVNFDDISAGDWYCYKTNEGRFGRFEVDSKGATSINLDFRTWK